MAALPDDLGIPQDIRSFFGFSRFHFDYGGVSEYFENGRHTIPSGKHLWTAGSSAAIEVIISYSVIDLLAFLSLNRKYYHALHHYAYVATGLRLFPDQIDWIRQAYPKQKITLVFGNDLAGRLTDIRLAAGLRRKKVNLRLDEGEIVCRLETKIRRFKEAEVSLYRFEKAFGVRTGIRTKKPRHSNRFFDQLAWNK